MKYVLDLAEIPTYQEGERARRPGFAKQIARGLELELDGRPAELKAVALSQSAPGPAPAASPRFASRPSSRLTGAGRMVRFEDTNFAGRIGWREVVVRADARRADRVLRRACDERERRAARLSGRPALRASERLRCECRAEGGLAPRPPARARRLGASGATGRRVREPDRRRTSSASASILVSLGLAFFWGAAHALSPGHGKAIVTAYLVGQRGTPRHAAALGLIVTATHTVGVFALGLVTLALSQFIVPEQLYPWIGLVSGLLVIGVGASVLLARIRPSPGASATVTTTITTTTTAAGSSAGAR